MPYTKIVATLGPASRDPDVLAAMLEAGVDLVRINCSHGTPAEHLADVFRVREATDRVGRRVAVLADLQGPKVRVGTVATAGRPLESGGTVVLRAGCETADGRAVPVVYQHLATDVAPGVRVLLDDGRIELEVREVVGRDVHCEIVRGGVLRSRKGVNLPGVPLTAQSPTLKDVQDAAALVEAGVDYLALSFVRAPQDVLRLRNTVAALGSSAAIVAKLERPEAVDRLDAVLDAADGVMVARGDLGVEVGPERVPLLQKRIIAAANAHAKPVITATEMLESMVTAGRPTRAEASDVANAVFDGTSAVMLSAETAVGADPVQVVRYMVRICETAESAPELAATGPAPHGEIGPARAVARAVVQAVRDLRAVAVVVHTQTGSSSRLVSAFRPGVPILALSPSETTLRLAALHYGVQGRLVAPVDDSLLLTAQANAEVLATGLAREGDTVVVVAGAPGRAGGTNRLLVHRVEADFPRPDDPRLLRRRATDDRPEADA